MNIILNKDLKRDFFPNLDSYFLENKLNIIANIGVNNKEQKYYPYLESIDKTYLKNIGLVGLISLCYSNHLKLMLRPNDFWILLISEIAKEVNANPEIYRDLFTSKEDKEEITITHGSHKIPVNIFSNILSTKIKFNSDLLFPNFSTNNEVMTSISQSMFCDMSSAYYNYTMFLCGIPEIKLLGQQKDWILLLESVEKILDVFSSKSNKIAKYKNNVLPIYQEIVKTFEKNDFNKNFWLDIFTSKNIGSGGDLEIDGWIKQLFIAEHSVNKIQNFQENISSVKYKVISQNGEELFQEISGGFDIELNDDDFISLKYSKYIFKLQGINK